MTRPRVALPAPTQPNERWSVDFMRDTLANGWSFRLFTVVDDCTQECPVIAVDVSLGAGRVVQALARLVGTRGVPRTLVLDKGSEFHSRALDAWAFQRGVHLQFLRPGRPVENAFLESFNGRVRGECLNQHWFQPIREARR